MHIKVAGKARGDKRERTIGKLIAAASELVAEKGFERTTLEEVAAKAGVTRGSIYSNFRNREALFLAVAQTQWEPVVPALVPGAPLRDQMARIAEAVLLAAPTRHARAVGAASFQAFALTHEEMRGQLAKSNEATYEWARDQLLKFVSEEELPMPALEFVKVVHALTEGLFALRALTPDLITNEVIVAAFTSLAGNRAPAS